MPQDPRTIDRRNFLKVAGLVPVAVGAAAAGDPAEAEPSAPDGEKQGYRETQHIRTFYRAARF